MNKRERLEKTLIGDAADRVPVMLWRHWPGDDQRAADLAAATLAFQKAYDWDLVNVAPASTYCVADYGVQTEWGGALSGERDVLKYPVKRSLQWTELRPQDPMRGQLAKTIEAINLIDRDLRSGIHREDVPIIVTIYSPLTQAAMISGDALMLQHMRTHPDRLHTGLNAITETLLNFILALRRTNIDGIFYVMRHADFTRLSEAEYQQFGLPYDRKFLDSLPEKWWLNILQLSSMAPMFNLAATYPLPVINWNAEDGAELDRALGVYRGAFCTGLVSQRHLHMGTPTVVRDAARATITHMDSRRLILAAEDKTLVSTPLSNLRATREVVESAGSLRRL